MKEFKPSDTIELKAGSKATVVNKLGEGGQGVVYQIELNGKRYALKWYSQPCKKEFYENLDANIRNGAPAATFLWPQFITAWKEQRFGYIMDLRPQGYHDFSHFLLAKVRFANLSAMISAALHICHAFRELHRKGYSYQDLNDGNFFINPKTGDVLICDNDNVAPYGKNLGIAGKCRYMAPEVVTRKNLPNADSDRFSLAIILFMLLFGNHPLEGKLVVSVPCLTDEMERRFYGSNPLFIYDPNNDTNRPVTGIHSNVIRRWPVFPEFVRKAFNDAFSADCIHNPNRRNPENEWMKLFVKLRDITVQCGCGSETFIDLKAGESKCLSCGASLGNPLVLHIGRHQVVMFPGKKTCNVHTKQHSDDFTNVTGEVIRNKNNPALWGLRNLCSETWVCTLPDGKQKNTGTGEVVPLFKDVKIDFGGGIKGKID